MVYAINDIFCRCRCKLRSPSVNKLAFYQTDSQYFDAISARMSCEKLHQITIVCWNFRPNFTETYFLFLPTCIYWEENSLQVLLRHNKYAWDTQRRVRYRREKYGWGSLTFGSFACPKINPILLVKLTKNCEELTDLYGDIWVRECLRHTKVSHFN